MKSYSLFAFCAIAAFTFAACSKNIESTEEGNPDSGVKSVTLSINGVKMTKSQITEGDGSWLKAFGISQLDSYFTTAGDVIQYSYRLSATENQDAWNAITSPTDNKIRFIGLDGVSRVYVVANSKSALLTKGANVSQISADLLQMYGTLENDDVLYAGADVDLSPIGNEVAGGVGDDIIEGGAEMAAQYYTAAVSIRPVISRLEIGKVSSLVSGSTKIQGEADQTWTVAWTGFQPKLTGIYMSDFYGTLAPVAPTTGDYFETPAGNMISGGVWEDAAGLRANLNVSPVTLYSNWSDNAYGNLFADEPGPDGESYVYFNGNGTTCVPFNFLVPFDVTSTAPSVSAASGFVAPKFHFQFEFDQAAIAGFDIVSIIDDKTTQEVQEGTELYDQLTAKLVFTTASTEGNIYYANVTGFVEDNSGTAGDAVTVAPNTIYRMSEVQINPFNMTGGTVSSDDYNIIVSVKVLEYNEVPVLPSFE